MRGNETILIQGASGSIGLHAALLMRAMGIETFVSSGSVKNKIHLKNLGFENVVSYSDHDWISVLKANKSSGVDFIFDLLGPVAFDSYFDLIRPNGRIVMIDALLGDVCPIDVGKIFTKGIQVTGSLLRPQSLSVKSIVRDSICSVVLPLVEVGSFNPVIGKKFVGLSSVKDAFEAYDTRIHFGKIVVEL